MPARRYLTLLRHRPAGPLLTASLVGRLPWGMTGLALILLVTGRGGSYGQAGLVAAAYTVGSGVSGPVLGMAADRFGRRPLLVPSALAYAAVLAGMAAAGGRRLPVLLVWATAAGLVQPPLAAAARSLWPALLSGEQLDAMYALEATLQELVFILGPMLVATLVALGGAGAPLVASGLASLVGSLAFAVQPAAATRTGAPVEAGVPGRRRALALLVVCGALLVWGLDSTAVGVIAFAGGHRSAGVAAVLLAVWSGGSLVGGLVFGTRAAGWPLAVLLLAVTAHFALLAVAPGRLVLGALLAVGGSSVAPTMARLYGLVGTAAGERSGNAAFGYLAAGLVVGSAAGNAVGGALVGAVGDRATFVAAAAVCALAAALARPAAAAVAA